MVPLGLGATYSPISPCTWPGIRNHEYAVVAEMAATGGKDQVKLRVRPLDADDTVCSAGILLGLRRLIRIG